MSKSNSTRESVVFTACPPGPDERENRQTSSDSGITLERTRSGPDTRQGCPLCDAAAQEQAAERSPRTPSHTLPHGQRTALAPVAP